MFLSPHWQSSKQIYSKGANYWSCKVLCFHACSSWMCGKHGILKACHPYKWHPWMIRVYESILNLVPSTWCIPRTMMYMWWNHGSLMFKTFKQEVNFQQTNLQRSSILCYQLLSTEMRTIAWWTNSRSRFALEGDGSVVRQPLKWWIPHKLSGGFRGWTFAKVTEGKLGIINYMGVSKNNRTPKSSILIGFSIINYPFWDTPIFGNTHIDDYYIISSMFVSIFIVLV